MKCSNNKTRVDAIDYTDYDKDNEMVETLKITEEEIPTRSQ
jgi:hypothetical protein